MGKRYFKQFRNPDPEVVDTAEEADAYFHDMEDARDEERDREDDGRY
jgi:hypothetical protein